MNQTIQHIAIIMDGNRRWAKQHAHKPWIGHQEGINTLFHAAEFCLEKKIPHLTVYAFSLENFSRPQEELAFLFDLIIDQTKTALANLHKQNIRVQFYGDRSFFAKHITQSIMQLEQETAHHTSLQLHILFCYGGQQEIIAAAQKLAQGVKNNRLLPEDITIDTFSHALWTGNIPDPELVIRTGGAHRISNFLLFKIAYAELYFSNVFWPDLKKEDLEKALTDYQTRKRNFGS